MIKSYRYSYYGILKAGHPRRRDCNYLLPIDAGIAMNLLKFFFVKEMSRKLMSMYELKNTSAKIRKIDSEHPAIVGNVVDMLESYPVEGSYILGSYDGMNRKDELVVYYM